MVALLAAPAGAAAQRRHDHRRDVVRPHSAWLDRVARCESGGRWHINTGNGYFEFSLASWRAVGGRGYPHRASRLEQEYRAVLLLRVQGRRAWPVCGRRAA